MTDIYDETLKEYYGYNNLKPLQKQIIKFILEDKKDILAILATGYGKSICYQLPFLILKNKSIIIISPLIALMEDQKYNLEQKDIPVICFNSNMSQNMKNYEKQELLNSNHKIIYMTPEFIVGSKDFITELWSNNNLAFIAIDEAHCVSSWGSDFRPEYKELSCLKEWIPNLNLMALTATATDKVRKDIIKTLGMQNYSEIISSFDRPNLYIECRLKNEIKFDLEPYIDKYKEQYCIIYVRTREMTKTIVDVLKQLKVKAYAYHAGIDTKERQSIQQNFIKGVFKWIVATVAFGMGIDQNINLVIHYGSPGDIESYYQEIGRAGRDGSPSTCILLYDKDDMRINRFLLKDIKIDDYRKFRESQIRNMEKYIKSDLCRRKTILEYFGESYGSKLCNNCDNCLCVKKSTDNIQTAIQYPMYICLKFIIESKIKCGFGKLISILTGKKDSKVKDYYSNSFYGLGKDYNSDYWKYIINICIYNDLLKEETIKSGFGTMFKITSKTLEWYKKILLISKNIKSDTYEQYIFIMDDIKETYNVPKDCLDIALLIKTRNVSGLEEMIDNLI